MDKQAGNNRTANNRLLKNNELGVHIVELTICLPIFLIMLFGIYDTARLSLGASAVRAAVYQATRRAVGMRRVNTAPLNPAIFSSDDTANVTALASYPWKSLDVKSSDSNSWYSSNSPNPIYKVEAVALAYAYYIIKQSFGGVKWPCSDEENCVACRPLRTDPQYVSLFCVDSTANPCPQYAVKYLGMECKINIPLLSASMFFDFVPGYVPVSSTAFVSMDNYSGVMFEP